ncbi:hypothetical protein [Streptococcus pneumoniae]|uniref:hypothetical protein n=1 Tax=Streptococcus pneumoniae TaxID=1313 RepID=UPI0015D8B338|nr:hypothetical protein [Streptococcus pneumoniae]
MLILFENPNHVNVALPWVWLLTSSAFENLFKPRQLRLAGMVADFVSSIHNLKAVL